MREVALTSRDSGSVSSDPSPFSRFSLRSPFSFVLPKDLFVKESHRGKGVGKALFGCLGKLCKDRDCGRLEWSVLRVSGTRKAMQSRRRRPMLFGGYSADTDECTFLSPSNDLQWNAVSRSLEAVPCIQVSRCRAPSDLLSLVLLIPLQPSIAFYQSLGAKSMGEEWDIMRLEGASLMSLDKLMPANAQLM